MIEQVTRYLTTRARWGAMEYAFWLAALASIFVCGGYWAEISPLCSCSPGAI